MAVPTGCFTRSAIAAVSTSRLVDTTDVAAYQAGFNDRTQLVWGETIGNPRMTVPDLKQLAEIAHARGAIIGVDNTFGSPALVRPLEHGIDIVMHSATKYLGGHSDCLGGTLAVADQKLFDDLYFIQNSTGAVLDPFSSFLVARGLKTLDLRVREQASTAMKLADWLSQHPHVSSVLYPGLPEHPQHDIATRQFDGWLRSDADVRACRQHPANGNRLRINAALSSGCQFGGGGVLDRTAGNDVTRQLRRRGPSQIRNHRWLDPLVRWSRIVRGFKRRLGLGHQERARIT